LDQRDEPVVEDAAELGVLLPREELGELTGEAREVLRGPRGLDLEQGGNRVASEVGTVQIQAALVQEKVTQPGKILPQFCGDLYEQAPEVKRSAPGERRRQMTSLWRSRKSSETKLLDPTRRSR